MHIGLVLCLESLKCLLIKLISTRAVLKVNAFYVFDLIQVGYGFHTLL